MASRRRSRPPCTNAKATCRASGTCTAPSTSSNWAFPGQAVGDLLTGAHRLGFNGLNITHPCKQLVLEHLDEISPDARRLGAVNTVTIRDGRFIGHNTDFSGFAAALAAGLPDAKLDRVVQLGAGGAGSAVAYALLTAGVRRAGPRGHRRGPLRRPRRRAGRLLPGQPRSRPGRRRSCRS